MGLLKYYTHVTGYLSFFLENGLTESYEEVRKKIDDLMEESKSLALKDNISMSDYENARFAVFAWIDELILNSAWDGKSEWRRNLLQREFYNTQNGGVEFYEKLEKLGHEENHIREVYYFCLVSGFTGTYGMSAEDIIKRDAVKSKHLKYLTGTSDSMSGITDILFKQAYPRDDNFLKNKKKSWFSELSIITWIIILSPVVIFIFLYVIYSFILNNSIS